MPPSPPFASILDSLQDLSSLLLGALAFAVLFLVLEGLDRV
jgi:hypothetical protein